MAHFRLCLFYHNTQNIGGKKGWKSYGTCSNFPQVVSRLPTPEQVSKAVKAINEVHLSPPESYWFEVQVTQVTANPT